MAYFQELPNLQYVSRFPNQSTNRDTVLGKNIYRRGKLREDISNAITVFQYYTVKEGERPDQLAERFYNDPELDWVLLIVNNIIDYYSEWPLNNYNFYEYLLDKYGSEEELAKVLYYETNEVRDEFNRIVVPAGIRVDPSKTQTLISNGTDLEYDIQEFPIPEDSSSFILTINLSSFLPGWERDNLGTGATYTGEEYIISNVLLRKPVSEEFVEDPTTGLIYAPPVSDYGLFPIYPRGGEAVQIVSPATLESNWPGSWGIHTPVFDRAGNEYKVEHLDTFGPKINITIDKRLYVITEREENGKIIPVFKFIPVI
jgi:hypothetical protein